MDRNRLNSKHIILLLLYSPGVNIDPNESIIGRTRIIKMMFLFKEEIKSPFLKDDSIEDIDCPEFLAWKYGPFSKEIYNDLEFFINNGYIISERLKSEVSDYGLEENINWIGDSASEEEGGMDINIITEERFQLSEKGMTFTDNKLFKPLSNNQKLILKIFKRRINEASLNAILRYIYIKYPNYTKKSKIRDEILGQY